MWGRGEKYILYLAWASGGNRARVRARSRWELKIILCRREIQWRSMDKIHMAKNREKLVLL